MSKIKLYPVCNWERNQHKMYNYNDKMYIKAHEENTEEAMEAQYYLKRRKQLYLP